MKIVDFSFEKGSKYYGKIDGTRFFIGSRVSYEGGKGLMNLSGTAAQKYDRAGFRDIFGFWADFIHPTAMAEGALGITHFKGKMAAYAKQYALDGKDDTICLVVTDIRHQGRAKSPTIVTALNSPNPLHSLLSIGEPRYHERVLTLRREIKALTEDGTFGGMKYSAAKGDFVKK